MFKRLLTIGLIFIAISSRADDGQKVASKVQKVILFLNGAQVTRTASVDINSGTSTLVFGGISPGIDAQSIQVHAGGDFTILSVKNELNYLAAANKEKDIATLEEQQKTLSDKLKLQNSLFDINQQEEDMLLKNQLVTGQNSNLDVLKLKQALDFQTERLTEIKKKALVINDGIRVLNEELQKYTNQIYTLQRGSEVTSNILVTVSSKTALQTEFTLNYVVHNASWYPSYDIRAKNINSPISISYKANVSQHSGEDWKNIQLTLSTGNPTVSGSKPELNPYYLNYGMSYNNYSTDKLTSISGRVTGQSDGLPLPGVTVSIKGTSIATSTDVNGYYTIQVPDANETLMFSFVGYQQQQRQGNTANLNVSMSENANSLSEVVVVGYGAQKRSDDTGALSGRVAGVAMTNPIVVNQADNQTNVEFKIDNPYSIPNDGKQYTVEIQQIDVDANYQYAVTPKLNTDVFLTAKIIDWNKYNLLAGQANVFFEGTYIGKTLLNTNSTADTLNISLGNDKNIQVTRTLQKELTQRQSIGSNRKDTRDWQIEIRNRKKQPINLLVEDQVPVSQNASIEVDNQELSDGNLDPATGKVTWNLKLSPQDDKKLELKYQVKYPKNQSIIVQ